MMNRDGRCADQWLIINRPGAGPMARPWQSSADLTPHRTMSRWLTAALIAALAGGSGPAAAKASRPAIPGGYDGAWNVVIVTQAGTCDQSYSFPVRIVGGRVQSGGMADVSGMVRSGGS